MFCMFFERWHASMVSASSWGILMPARSCSMSNKLLTATDEAFLHQAVTSPTRNRSVHLPSTLDLGFSKYSCSSTGGMALSRPADLGQLRAYQLAPPATTTITSTLLARFYAFFMTTGKVNEKSVIMILLANFCSLFPNLYSVNQSSRSIG